MNKHEFKKYFDRFLARHVYVPIVCNQREKARECKLNRAYGLSLSALLRIQEAALRISRTLDGMLRVETLDRIYKS